MSRHKEKFVLGIIILYAGYFYYFYVNHILFPQQQQQSGEVIREFKNPLTIIFLGRQSLSADGTQYTSYDAISRTSSAIYLALIILLTVGVINYLRSHSNDLLKVVLMVETWRTIGLFVFTFFYYAWNKFHPENDMLQYHRDFFTGVHATLLAEIIAGIFILRNLPEPSFPDPSVNLSNSIQGIRGFHFLFDRLLLLLLGNNFFIFLYVYQGAQSATTWIWMITSLEVALLTCYFLCEKLTGTSPGKILTGTRVMNANDPQRNITTGAVLKRTLTRIIPFEPLSFLSTKGGWHDRLSGTTVRYVAKGHWLLRQNRLVFIVFSTLLFLVVWFLVGWMNKVELMHCRACVQSSELPQYLGMILFLLGMFLFTGWLAAVTQYALNLSSRSYPSSYSILAVMATLWIPVYNFGVLRYTVAPLLDAWEASGISEGAKQKLKRGATLLHVCFVLFYIFIFCALLSIKVMNGWFVMDAILFCVSLGIICWCIGTLKFSVAVNHAVQEAEAMPVV